MLLTCDLIDLVNDLLHIKAWLSLIVGNSNISRICACVFLATRRVDYISAMTFWSAFHLLCSLIVLLLLAIHTNSSDPDQLQDFCVADLKASASVNGFPCKPAAEVTSDDFFFDGLSKEGNTTNMFGWSATPANVLSFPGLNTLGISMNRVDFTPGGLNPPHSHPRATETGVVIQGKLLVGFITTSNVFHSKVLSVGQMFVVPRGLVHFQLNVGAEKALIFTAFNSQLPGSAVASTTLFASTPSIPNQVLTKAFNVGDDIIDTIKSKFVRHT